MLVKTKGIIISETNYSETSKILNVLTEDYGKIGIMAKGARSMKSPLRSVSQKLVYGEFNLNYKEKGLSNLLEVNVLNSFKNIITNFKAATYSFYLLDLVNQILNDDSLLHDKNKDIFKLLEISLIKINEGLNPELIVNIVELQLLKYLGVSLELNKCINCGNKDNIKTINLELGGMLCENCLKENSLLNPKTVKLIRLMYYVDLNKLDNIKIEDKSIIKEISTFIKEYYGKYTGIYLKSKDNIEKILINL